MLDIQPNLLERREGLLELERRRPEDLKHFFSEAQRRFGGKDVSVTAMWGIMFDWADGGLKHGLKGVFGSRSVIVTGGGKKGRGIHAAGRNRGTALRGLENF